MDQDSTANGTTNKVKRWVLYVHTYLGILHTTTLGRPTMTRSWISFYYYNTNCKSRPLVEFSLRKFTVVYHATLVMEPITPRFTTVLAVRDTSGRPSGTKQEPQVLIVVGLNVSCPLTPSCVVPDLFVVFVFVSDSL